MNAFEKVKEYILQQLPVDEAKITLEAKLVDDLGADSANLMPHKRESWCEADQSQIITFVGLEKLLYLEERRQQELSV